MTYAQFETKWLGKRTDIDGVFGFQCVDLVKQYLLDCFGIPNGSYGDAIEWWASTHPKVLAAFDKVSGSNVKQGDIVVLTGGKDGHIGISTGRANGTSVEILEQNGTGDGDGKGGDEIRKRYVPKSRVAGLLRPKGEEMTTREEAIYLRRLIEFKHSPTEAEKKAWTGKKLTPLLKSAYEDPKFQARKEAVAKYPVVSKQVEELTKTVGIKDGEIKRLSKENETLRAQTGDKITVRGAVRVLYEAFINWISRKD